MKTSCHGNVRELPPRHMAAFDQAEHTSYDLSLLWFANLADTTLGPQHRLKLYAAEDEASQVVVVPMQYDETIGKPRTLKALANCYTALYAPVSSSAVTVELLGQALRSAMDDRPAWDVMDFSPLSVENGSFQVLFSALRSVGLLPFKYYCFGNWYLPVSGRSYAEYHGTLPSRLKNTLKRKSKQFLGSAGGRLEIITGGSRLEPGIADYQKVYATSWKVQEPFPNFIPGLLRSCAAKGWLRLGIAYLHDEPVAAQIWIVAHGRAAIFKLAYDEKFASYSAGSILSAHMMQQALDVERVHEVDYLIGDDPYKKDWMSHRRERWGIVAYNPRSFPGLAGALIQTAGGLRRILWPHGSSWRMGENGKQAVSATNAAPSADLSQSYGRLADGYLPT